MSDLLSILPSFVLTTPSFNNIAATLEKHKISTLDLLTLDVSDISTRTGIAFLELRRFLDVVTRALYEDLGYGPAEKKSVEGGGDANETRRRVNGLELFEKQSLLSTADAELDNLFGGGIATGCITEFVGEGGAGKTNALLHLLLAVQLPTEHGGLDGAGVYISTEGRSPTNRLAQLTHSFKLRFPDANVSMDRVFCSDLREIEQLEHTIRYRLPLLIERANVRLVAIDSIAAPFRAAAANGGGKSLRDPSALAKRSRQLAVLGQLLRNLAIKYDLVVVIANQVADKFSRNDNAISGGVYGGSSQTTGSQPGFPPPPPDQDDVMMLDYQARWFTGWEQAEGGKVPALGMSWTNCLAARIAVSRRMVEELDENDEVVESTRRGMKLVFAPWAQGGREIEFVIENDGVKGVTTTAVQKASSAEER